MNRNANGGISGGIVFDLGVSVLTDVAVRKAAPKESPYKLSDSQGLYLLVKPNGTKLWRLKYRFGGKEKALSFGAYPEVSLINARRARESAREELRNGQDPSLTRQQKRAEAVRTDNQFRTVALAWIAAHGKQWTPQHRSEVQSTLERFAFPKIGGLSLDAITPPIALDVVHSIEKRQAGETARRVRQRMGAIFAYGIACGLGTSNPADQIKGALAPLRKGQQPAIIHLEPLRRMMRRIEHTPSHPITQLALRFLALTSVRSGEVRGMLWTELEDDMWVIPPERMKMRREHVVPLSTQARAIIQIIRPLTGRGPLVFPNARWAHKPMSENAMGYLINRAGYAGQHVPHGFRASFSSIMNERRPEDRAIIDLMLAHVPKDAVEAAYNRAQHMERRKQISQDWADLLLKDAMPSRDLLQTVRRSASY
ncbi:tyrosine-type recombinase/integrase [Gluconobacter wancherniae]|uniref:tyrosine-type recombinase/integrase n=1 Tax=Gluconobacter wancherniae TaxID=1307955 RepID=UPI001B8BF66B|nr:integrase arm-type DNA-binding domain-containing protein [Gluconobacter wancherniae]MBS1093870.1 integrase arm-type DNA-binding domain-containing protein [Gluconobacter wancherniae]